MGIDHDMCYQPQSSGYYLTGMTRWKISYRLIAGLNLILCSVGVYWMSNSVIDAIQKHRPENTNQFFVAFGIMTILNIVFIALLVVASVTLFRLTPSAPRFYCYLVATYLVYEIVNGSLWLLPDPWGKSIGGATAVGNMGMAPFTLFLLPLRDWMIPYAYPIVSVVIVFIAGKQPKKPSAAASSLSRSDMNLVRHANNRVRLGTKIAAGVAGIVFLISTPTHGMGIVFVISSFVLIGSFLLLTLLEWPRDGVADTPHRVIYRE
jgi:hypothetical protein